MKNFSEIKKRILYHIDLQGISKRKFYDKTGISNGLLDKDGGVSELILEKFFSSYPEISAEWLFKGKGDMLIKPSSNYVSEPIGEYSTNNKSVPFYDISATASDLHQFHDSKEIPDGYIQFPGVEECDFAIPVYGDSMSPEINSGDYIAVKIIEERSFLNYGVKYFIITEEQRLVKYLHAHKTDTDLLILRSVNSQHEDITIDKKLIIKFYLIRFVFKREI